MTIYCHGLVIFINIFLSLYHKCLCYNYIMKRWLKFSRLAQVGRGEHGSGYTITEVMVVLAVSMVMFAAIVVAFSGRQSRVEFTQSVRDFEAQLQDVASDVASGYYHSNFLCTTNTIGPPLISETQQSVTGSSSDCIFLGKVVVPSDSSNSTSSVVSTLVGRRAIGGRDVETLDEAQPVVSRSADTSFTHAFQLKVQKIVRLNSSYDQLHAIGFINQLSRGVGSETSGENGLISIYGLVDPPLISDSEAKNVLHRGPSGNNFIKLPEGAIFCLLGQNGQRAEISVGSGRSQTAIVSEIDTSNEGACSE